MPERNNNITYEIKEHIGTISSWESGWNRELNLISWNGANPKYDIREWDENHDRMSKGITLHPWEMRNLVDLYLTNNSEKAVEKGRAREAERQKRRAEYRRTGSETDGQLEEVKAAPPFEAEPAADAKEDSTAAPEQEKTCEGDTQLELTSSETPASVPEPEEPDGNPLMEGGAETESAETGDF